MHLSRLEAIPEVPYWTRGVCVVVGLLVGACVEWWLRRARATRLREYLAWVAMAAVGAAYGGVNDMLTAQLSPAYFEFAKGLEPSAQDFSWHVLELGARAGTFAGFLFGGLILVANNPALGVPSLSYRRLALPALLPLALAAFASCLLARARGWDPQGLGADLRSVLGPSEVRDFLRVQRAHLGAYLGAAIGTLWACASVRRARREQVQGAQA